MGKTKGALLLFLLLSLILSTGCWNRKEIEEVGIVLGLGFDKPMALKTEAREEAIDHTREKRNRIALVNCFAIPKAFAAKEGLKKTYENVVNEGETVFKTIRDLSTRLGRTPSYQHLRVIVISEDIAQTINLNEIVNFLSRNTESRRTIKVLICQGRAKDVFEYPGLIIENPALRFSEIANNADQTLSMAPEIKLGEISSNLSGKTSFIVQRVITANKDIKIAGAAVIKGKSEKMAGRIGEKEVEGLNWLMENKKSLGIIEGVDPKSKKTIVYEVLGTKIKIRPKVKGDKISFTAEIETEGKLGEDWVHPSDAFEQDFVKRAEQATEEEIKDLIEKSLAKTQKELKVDVTGFGQKLSIEYPQVWKKVKKDWDDLFSEIPVDVKVKVKILEFGTKGKKQG